ncbi:MAG: transcriptional regulator, TetR family [Nevskia sp.]|nr:transcriptional regulator, TetR family [Nevskia sp.]
MSSTPAATGARSILDAATALFADEGYESVSVASIAAQAGVCKANVFHHFASKDELYLAVMKSASAEHADYAEELYQSPGSSADKVCKLIAFEIRNMLANHQRTRLLLRETNDGGHVRVRKLARTVFQRNFTAVVNIFEQGRERGEFRASIDPAAAAMLLGGATHLFFNCRDALREFREANGLETPDVYARRVAALILSGVLVAPEPQTHELALAHGKRARHTEATK